MCRLSHAIVIVIIIVLLHQTTSSATDIDQLLLASAPSQTEIQNIFRKKHDQCRPCYEGNVMSHRWESSKNNRLGRTRGRIGRGKETKGSLCTTLKKVCNDFAGI